MRLGSLAVLGALQGDGKQGAGYSDAEPHKRNLHRAQRKEGERDGRKEGRKEERKEGRREGRSSREMSLGFLDLREAGDVL